MGIYINDIEMPKSKPICIIIDPAGQVRRYDLNNNKYTDDELFEAIPLPPHGDLIERDALMDSNGDLWDGMWGWSGVQIANAPTIITEDEETDIQKEFIQNWHEEDEV